MADSPAQSAQPAQPTIDQNSARPQVGQVFEHPKERRERAFRMFCDGKAKTDIAFELQIPVGTIYAWGKRDEWDTRKGVESAGVNAETSQTVAKALAKTSKAAEPSNLDLAEKQEHYQAKLGDAAIRLSDHIATLKGDELVSQADKLLKADQIARKALKLESEKPSTVIQIGILAQPQAERRSELAARKAVILDVDAGVTPVPEA